MGDLTNLQLHSTMLPDAQMEAVYEAGRPCGLILMDSMGLIRGAPGSKQKIAAGPKDLEQRLRSEYGIHADVVGVSGLRFVSKNPKWRRFMGLFLGVSSEQGRRISG